MSDDIERGKQASADQLVSTWMEEQDGEHTDFFVRVLRKYYFPFLLRFHSIIILAWLVAIILCAVFGFAFLDMTQDSLDPPPGTPSADALDAMKANYPGYSSWPSVFIVYGSMDGSSVIRPESKIISDRLQKLAGNHSTVVDSVNGYFEFVNSPDLHLLARDSVSKDNLTMISTINFKASATQKQCTDLTVDLLEFAADESKPELMVRCTGQFALSQEMSDATTADMETTDFTVLPIALVILGATVQSYRHILLAVCNLGCTLLLAFGIMVPIAQAMSINPFTPAIMMTLGIAVCFDYTLFVVSRFREERIVLRRSKQDALFHCLATAGHVVLVSGSTLLLSFVMLLFFPQNFLQSVGVAATVVIFCAMLVNTTLSPSLILLFDCLSHFDLLPSRASICCIIPPEDPAVAARRAAVAAERSDAPRPGRKLWFWVADFATRYPWVPVLVSVAFTVPLAIAFFNITSTADDGLVFVHGSRSLEGLDRMLTAFPQGTVNPYDIVVVGDRAGAVVTSDYFDKEARLVARLLKEQSEYMDRGSVTALSFFQGAEVPFATAAAYLTEGSPAYATDEATTYRLHMAALMSSTGIATRIHIETTAPPTSQEIVGFIRGVRATLREAQWAAAPLPVRMYLTGAFTNTLDGQDVLYGLVPLEIGVTVALVLVIVAVSFQSVAHAVRLFFTVLTSLAWTFGLLCLTYQRGEWQDAFRHVTPSLQWSAGVYWVVPPMSFSILVGLALDYDVLLMSRVVELRRAGWSDLAATCLAVEKAAGIITAAGLIMSVSFAGLLGSSAIVLNQYGFVLFVGVAVDTFLVRTTLVPACLALVARFGGNWWPGRMPAPALDPAAERAALLAGLSLPRRVDGSEMAALDKEGSGGARDQAGAEGLEVVLKGAAPGPGESPRGSELEVVGAGICGSVCFGSSGSTRAGR